MNAAGLIQIAVGAVLINNLVFSRFVGLCPFLGTGRRSSSALGMGVAVVFVITCTSAITWPVYRYILEPAGLGYLQTVVFILVIAALVQSVEMVLLKLAPSLHQSMGIYLPLITTNCAILAVALINSGVNTLSGHPFTFVEALVNGAASGTGFLVALLLMSSVRERLRFADIPAPLRGLPIAFVAAGLMAMAFLGFSGFDFFK